MITYHDLVEFLRAWYHLEASPGSTASVKEGRVLNGPTGSSGADFDQIPVSIIFDVSPYHIFCFVDNATQMDPAA